MDFQRWLDDGGSACCPDPDTDQFDPEIDGTEIDAIVSFGFDPDTTPVDTLMAGPISMHLQHADDLENGPNRDWAREYANV